MARAEGEAVSANQVLFSVDGPARALLTGERTALNFLQLLSGTATRRTLSRSCSTERIAACSTPAKPFRDCAPRKNTRCAWAAATITAWDCSTEFSSRKITLRRPGAIALAVAAAKRNAAKVPVEVEVEDLAQLQAAIDAGADIAMLDNFSLQAMREGVALNAKANVR